MNESASTSGAPGSSTLKSLLFDLRAESTHLLQKEVELAKAELSEKASAFGRHAMQVAIAGAVAYAGLIVLLFGLGDLIVLALTRAGVDGSVATWLGPTLIGVVVALIGWLMLNRARKAMKTDDLVPEQTLQSMRENKEWMQQKLQHSHEPI